jgi:maltose-binding protein MalE
MKHTSVFKEILVGFIFFSTMLLSACRETTPPLSTPTSSTTIEAELPSPTATQDLVQGTVRIWHSWDEKRMPALLKTIAQYQSIYPAVQFDVLYVPPLDLKASYEAASLEGRAPSILLAPAEWGPELFDQGMVADVAPFSAESVDQLNPAALGAARYRDALVGLPIDIEGVVLYRNQSIIPLPPETFEELISFAQSANAGKTIGAYLERSFVYSGAHLLGVGGSLMDASGYPAFNDQFGITWLTLLQNFEAAGPVEFFGDNDLEMFKEDRVGWIIESTQVRNDLQAALGSAKLAIDPWPVLDNGALSGFVQAENIYLHPQAVDEPGQISWKFIEQMLTAEAQAALAETGSIPAITLDVLKSRQIVIEDQLIEEAMEALAGGSTYPVLPEMAVYPPVMDDALQSVFNGSVPPDQALQTAEETIISVLDSLKSTPTPSP